MSERIITYLRKRLYPRKTINLKPQPRRHDKDELGPHPRRRVRRVLQITDAIDRTEAEITDEDRSAAVGIPWAERVLHVGVQDG